jgi:hypothetical protein
MEQDNSKSSNVDKKLLLDYKYNVLKDKISILENLYDTDSAYLYFFSKNGRKHDDSFLIQNDLLDVLKDAISSKMKVIESEIKSLSLG